LLFQKLKDAKKNPVFMLKHIKDIRSPIAVAQQKHAARKASESTPNMSNGAKSGPGGRPPKLQVDHAALANASTPLMTGNPLHTGWPELMSPAVENKADASGAADTPLAEGGQRGTGSPGDGDTTHGSSSGHGAAPREMLPMQGVSYAVAIYPYMAEQGDEFDVVVYVVLLDPLSTSD
jgi:protein STE50